MSLSEEQTASVKAIIKESLRKKFQSYKPESGNMPFHYRLLGRDKMALYSFIHSLSTTFGTSIFEPVAVALAKTRFVKAQSRSATPSVSELTLKSRELSMNYRRVSILKNGLINAKKFRELGKFAEKVGSALRTVKVDVFLEDQKGSIFLLDLKTAKPNISNFKDFKRTLLEWCAILLTKTPDVDVHSLIAIPYNPYEPAPYERWTLKGMLDLDRELKVADEFWDFLGGEEAYQELLDCFERVGCELRPEIDRYFEGFRVSSHSSTGDVH